MSWDTRIVSDGERCQTPFERFNVSFCWSYQNHMQYAEIWLLLEEQILGYASYEIQTSYCQWNHYFISKNRSCLSINFSSAFDSVYNMLIVIQSNKRSVNFSGIGMILSSYQISEKIDLQSMEWVLADIPLTNSIWFLKSIWLSTINHWYLTALPAESLFCYFKLIDRSIPHH